MINSIDTIHKMYGMDVAIECCDDCNRLRRIAPLTSFVGPKFQSILKLRGHHYLSKPNANIYHMVRAGLWFCYDQLQI